MRLCYPALPIFVIKIDLNAAYMRLHITAKMALLTITIIKEIAYILLRLPFGVSNGPNDYSLISEPIMDLTNDILLDPTYDPSEINLPIKEKFQNTAQSHNDDIPFGKARPLFVEVPFRFADADGYIDDIISVALGVGNLVAKA